MKTTILLLGLLLSNVTVNNGTVVYLCDSAGEKKYHFKSNCRGLSNCSHRIVKLTIVQAKKSGRTLCRWEK